MTWGGSRVAVRRGVFGLAGALLLAAASAAGAQPPAVTPPAVTPPDWLRKPTNAELQSFYPRVAAVFVVEGQAALSCAVEISGQLSACRIADDRPAGFGFGAAALRMAPEFLMRPLLVDGRPAAGSRITVPIHFKPRAVLSHGGPLALDAAALEDARRIVALVPPGDPLGAMMAQPFGLTDDGETPPETLLAALNVARDALATHKTELADVPARALSLTFGPAELKALAAQAESPATRPQVLAALGGRYQQIIAAAERASGPLLEQAYREAREAFCRTHECQPALQPDSADGR